MVPKGWSHTTLGKVMVFKNGLNFTKADVGEEIKIVGVSDFKDLSELRSTERLESVNVASHIKDDELLTDGDLLFVRSNGNKDLIGRCLFFPEVKERLSFSGFTIRGRADKKNILPQYIAFVARSSFFKSQISQYGGGTNISNLSQQILNDIALPLPPHDEQKKIVQILSTWDKAISTTEQLLANSQQQKKALMQQLLTGKKRLLDSNGVRFSGEWITIPLEKLCHINPKRPPEPKDGLVSFIPMEFVSEDAKLLSTSERFYTDVSKGFTSFLDGDILIAKITPCFENGKGCYVQGMKNGVGFGSTEFHVLRANKLSSPLYLYYMTNTSEFRIKGEANMQGSAGQKRVTTDYLKSLKVTVPKQVEEQQKIAVVISTADQDITALQQKLDALKQEKKALMQQLLTGKRRVKIDNKEVA
ncbi:restriction endonuclease subunit S [Aeromonas popoffii]|uniref:Restriction endonuclease subunit S n=1 Tax=Aeromonas popoffii TaxID=70856 RepID=A0ABS5GLC2_9GAMM|nr:restriction endonuclease subunit S [Aeromonas popoffii]MBR7627940.1 restriction endonuclease subunit S [Aeromonas popoffii]